MQNKIGLISLFNIIIILILLTLTLNSYHQSKNTQSLISNNLNHNLTYLQARSSINHLVNDAKELSIDRLQANYDLQVAGNLITYQLPLDFNQTITLSYDYQKNQIISLQVTNDSDYQIDDQAPVYTGE